MTTAYVLINCDLGSKDDVFSQLKSIREIETQGVFGAYDIITKIKAPNSEIIKNLIISKIRVIARIRSTLTLLGNENEQ